MVHGWRRSLIFSISLFFISQAYADFFSVKPLAIEEGVRASAFDDAQAFYNDHKDLIANLRYVTFFDVAKHSGQKRFYLIDLLEDKVESFFVAHGKGSDPDHDGYATQFSNIIGSKMTSLGFYLTGGLYDGQHGLSMYLDGLEESNSNARERAIVVHGADYVNPSWSKMGRSFGCPALEMKQVKAVVEKIKSKSLMYIYY